jgi:hypothetical protein
LCRQRYTHLEVLVREAGPGRDSLRGHVRDALGNIGGVVVLWSAG